jgi:hypothetical protein
MARNTRSQGRRHASPNDVNGKSSSTAAVADRPAALVTTLKAKPTTAEPTLAPARPKISIPVSHEQIAVAAHQLWEQRGGSAERNWLDAEAMLRKQAEV